MRDRDMERITGALRGLPVVRPPAGMTARLRVVASRERRTRQTWKQRLRYQAELLALWSDNLMRPMAVPVAGGFLSAILLFAMMAPGLTVNRHMIHDVPTALATEATIQNSFGYELGDEDIVVDVMINEQGSVVDYSIPTGQRWFSNPSLRKGVENALVCTRFSPATVFGQAITGKTRITFRRSRVDVKG